jgi:hypothetical protein
MAKRRKVFIKREIIQLCITAVVVLVIIIAGFFLCSHFLPGKKSTFLIENKYYGFKLQTPKGWIAKEKTAYSEDSVNQLLEKCKNDGTSAYGIGAFKFEDQRYSDDLIGSVTLPAGLASGAILSIEINCVPDDLKGDATKGLSDNLQIAGEKAFQGVADLSGFGPTKHISLFHNNFQYSINEYIYVSPNDKKNEADIRQNYNGVFDKILSGFEFIK